MLQALLCYDYKTAVFNLPHNSLEVENYLLSVGALKPYGQNEPLKMKNPKPLYFNGSGSKFLLLDFS